MSRYARLEVNLVAFLGAVATVLTGWLWGWWAIIPAAVTLALLSFYRDPPRRVPAGSDLLIAPADGTVMRIERASSEADGADALRIVIFLSVFNVHVNRAPCAGTVRDVVHHPGRFINALKNEATELNEHTRITLDPRPPLPGPVRLRQIAGALARRIVCTLRPGDRVAAGQRFGMIKLGSQAEVSVPDDPRWEVAVRPSQRVRAGVTVLARYRPADE
ncbi:MAG: phosphatidylserine decarboxylase family protein [Phycisphaerae bacterium]